MIIENLGEYAGINDNGDVIAVDPSEISGESNQDIIDRKFNDDLADEEVLRQELLDEAKRLIIKVEDKWELLNLHRQASMRDACSALGRTYEDYLAAEKLVDDEAVNNKGKHIGAAAVKKIVQDVRRDGMSEDELNHDKTLEKARKGLNPKVG